MKKLLIIIISAALVLPVFGNAYAAEAPYDGIARTWLFLEGERDRIRQLLAEGTERLARLTQDQLSSGKAEG